MPRRNCSTTGAWSGRPGRRPSRARSRRYLLSIGSTLELLNRDPDSARELLLECCGSPRWVALVGQERPYDSPAALRDVAQRSFDRLTHEDWLQAFAAHARIGAPRAGDERGRSEQAGAASANAVQLAELEDANQRYEVRFGHVFLVRASGLDAGTMLAALRERLDNSPARELEIAAAQQREITALRLDSLLAP